MRTLLFLALSLLAAPLWADESPAPPAPVASVHADLSCGDCHPEGTKRGVDCMSCHSDVKHLHVLDIRPSFEMPPEFPLTDGKIDCVTCHQVHGGQGFMSLRGVSSAQRTNLEKFCTSCHRNPIIMLNPHMAREGTDRCGACHPPLEFSEIILENQKPPLRAPTDQLCNFCHDVRGKEHPRNIDPSMKTPENLPLAPDGSIGCQTCHDPHGSVTMTHYIREAYAEYFVRDKDINPHDKNPDHCGYCHVEEHNFEITKQSHHLRMGDDAMMLCMSCHPSSRSHHPVGVVIDSELINRIPSDVDMPLSPDKRIVCTTCHSNNCEDDSKKMDVRYFSNNPPNFDLCWYCHDKQSMVNENPHTSDINADADRCLACHDRPPVKSGDTAGKMYFVSSIRMMCLGCHENYRIDSYMHDKFTATPNDRMLGRMAALAEGRKITLPLEHNGTITCTTCHNAHFTSVNSSKKVRIGNTELCKTCHLQGE